MKAGSVTVAVRSIESEPYELRRTLYVVVQPAEESFVATFAEANINASGETVPDSVSNLKDMMILLYERLLKESKSKLGKEPTRQLAVLQELLMRRE